ncbi:MAG: Fe-S cluster assembly protein SufD [Pseudomonadota bacterium]
MNDVIEHYVDQHVAMRSGLPGNSSEWLQQHRQQSISAFEKLGFPTVRNEAWKYTDTKLISNKHFVIPEPAEISAGAIDQSVLDAIDGIQCYRVVLHNGRFVKERSILPDKEAGVAPVVSLAEVIEEMETTISSKSPFNDGLQALNQAFLADGVVVRLAAKQALDKPLEILHITSGDRICSQPNVFLTLGEGSKAVVVERYVTSDAAVTWTNSQTRAQLEADSSLDHYIVQTSSAKSYLVTDVEAKQNSGSRYSARTITLGSGLTRNNLSTHMLEEHAHCDMFGLYSMSGRQHVDNYTTMIHGAANCSSRELYKGVLNQRSRGVFHGRIKVEKDAQKTDAEQSNNTLLLSRDAEIDTKPQLEIYADDVKCSHGATIGQIDKNSLFYLRSRGIDDVAARSLLTFAFVNDVLAEVEIPELREYLESQLISQLVPGEEVA